jgi:putative phage-type endonuclease
MNTYYCEQRSDEWFQLRLGKVTASNFSTAMSNGSGRKTYMMKLLAERMTGIPHENYSAKWMDEGSELEPEAREYYEKAKGVNVVQVGFVDIGDIGVSPDGFVGDDGGLEIKCPFPSTHLGWILKGKLPPEHKAQVQGTMWVCERKWWDFVSFDPRVKHRPIWVFRENRDDDYINDMAKKINKFIQELENLEFEVSVPF